MDYGIGDRPKIYFWESSSCVQKKLFKFDAFQTNETQILIQTKLW